MKYLISTFLIFLCIILTGCGQPQADSDYSWANLKEGLKRTASGVYAAERLKCSEPFPPEVEIQQGQDGCMKVRYNAAVEPLEFGVVCNTMEGYQGTVNMDGMRTFYAKWGNNNDLGIEIKKDKVICNLSPDGEYLCWVDSFNIEIGKIDPYVPWYRCQQ